MGNLSGPKRVSRHAILGTLDEAQPRFVGEEPEVALFEADAAVARVDLFDLWHVCFEYDGAAVAVAAVRLYGAVVAARHLVGGGSFCQGVSV